MLPRWRANSGTNKSDRKGRTFRTPSRRWRSTVETRNRANGFATCRLAYDALIFDCDGVLVDSEPLHAETWVEIFTRHGVPMTIEGFARFLGMTSPQMLAVLAQEGGISPELDHRALIVERRDLYWERIAEGLDEIPGTEAFLRALAPRAALAMATSNPRETYDRILDVMGWRDLFSAAVGVDEVAHAKPAPDIYLRAVERLGVPAEKCLVFEDSLPGIEAARAAGLDVAGLATSHDGATLLAHGARCALRDFTDHDTLRAALARES